MWLDLKWQLIENDERMKQILSGPGEKMKKMIKGRTDGMIKVIVFRKRKR